MNINAALVSCIMPTANRAQFIPLAIEYFLRQDYPNTELVIVDDGTDAIKHLLPECSNIQYIRMQPKALIGAKRNMACDAAKGGIIIHWDDDDWYAPDWISKQVAILTETQADICGLSQLFFYAPLLHKAWKYVYPKSVKQWVGGATMAYRKEFWKKQPFKNVQVGEDNSFVWNTRGKVAAHDHLKGFVSILHPGNTSPKYVNNAAWKAHDAGEIAGILQTDDARYTEALLQQTP